jgi:hypothetical protein
MTFYVKNVEVKCILIVLNLRIIIRN